MTQMETLTEFSFIEGRFVEEKYSLRLKVWRNPVSLENVPYA